MSEDQDSNQSNLAAQRRFVSRFLLASRVLLVVSGVLALLVLVLGFSRVHCSGPNCGGIIKFQYFHYRNLIFGFVAVQLFGWFTFIEGSEGTGRWNFWLSMILLLVTAWVFAVVFHWDWLATFYFSKIAPHMVRFFLL